MFMSMCVPKAFDSSIMCNFICCKIDFYIVIAYSVCSSMFFAISSITNLNSLQQKSSKTEQLVIGGSY